MIDIVGLAIVIIDLSSIVAMYSVKYGLGLQIYYYNLENKLFFLISFELT